jgi:uncharacterized protein
MVNTKSSITRAAHAVGVATLFVSLFLLFGCSMKDHTHDESTMPRFTKLDMFNPHRPSFECKHEATVNPPITPEAEALFQQAQLLGSYELWPQQRNYPKMAVLYEQAMKLGHWKAQFNLAGLYLKGEGVQQDIEKALQLTEDLMKKGVPAAWDNMGAYYMGGVGPVKQDATVAYAFWQKAADMGSMAAQTYLGAKLIGIEDEPPRVWANRKVGIKMLECAFAQGYGQAAYELGSILHVITKDYPRALKVLHEGVKFGSEDSAGALSVAFRNIKPLTSNFPDIWRADRYRALADALYTNPDLRFPNLDKVLPLPPARLPQWDGKKESLINAAKAVVIVPPAPPKPAASAASQRVGRAHIPQGWVLPEKPQLDNVMLAAETTAAQESGYWLAQLLEPRLPHHTAWDAAQVPLRYSQGEPFDRSRTGLQDEDGRIVFRYLGVPVAEAPPPPPAVHPLVARGLARYIDPPVNTSGASKLWRMYLHLPTTCPQTGIWAGCVPDNHPLASVFNQWHQQVYAHRGDPFPVLQTQALGLELSAITWHWLGQSNREENEHTAFIHIEEPTWSPLRPLNT